MADEGMVGRGLKAIQSWVQPGKQGDLGNSIPPPTAKVNIPPPAKQDDYKGYSYSGYIKAGGSSKYDDWKKEVDKFNP